MLRDRYKLLETVGSGGEGRVVHAIDTMHDRHVALKIRPSDHGVSKDDLLREARTLLTLEPHPSLPLVRDDFFEDGEYIVAMDWIDGIDLAQLLRERGAPGLPPSSVLRYLAQAAEALTHLHAHDPQIVHGDVKPSNLVLGTRGQVVLVDFGVSSTSTASSRRQGTLGFVAPEVAAGDRPTPCSDVYALAATAHALLTGDAPSGDRASFDAISDDRADAMEAAVRMGLSTNPKRRPQSAGELVQRLRIGWETDLPTGVLTFVFTDIEGSTPLWEQRPDVMGRMLLQHDEIVAECVEGSAGRLIRSMGEGDSTFSVFQDPVTAVRAATEIVTRIGAEPWPDALVLGVRAGVHTGEAEFRDGTYFGSAVIRGARIRDLAAGGQIFVSNVTADLVRHATDLVDLGPHTLRGIRGRENVFAVDAPELAAPPSPMVCPFRGLLAFDEEHREFFFGRERVVAELADRLRYASIVGLIGASGSGKSSVVGAGLASASDGRTIARITPGTDPMKQLGTVKGAEIIVVDQFEELFTLCTDLVDREAFVDALLTGGKKLVVAVRADFYSACATYPELARALAANHILLGPLDATGLERAIEGPAEAVGMTFESGLVDLILRDVAGEPGALPLLEHALLETWERRDGRTLTLAGYEDAGGVSAGIGKTADREYDDLDEIGQTVVRRIFVRLTQLGEGTEDTRRRVLRSELSFPDIDARSIEDVVDGLVQARLVVVDGETIEVSHEALLREWPRLRGWLDEDREGLQIHRHLTEAARSWEEMGRDSSELYRGRRLAAVTEVNLGELNSLEQAFIDASRNAAEAERQHLTRTNRRLRSLLTAAAIALVLALIAGGVAFVQRSTARAAATRAEVSKLAAQSREVTQTDPDLAALLAVEAHRHLDSVESRGAELGILSAQPRLITQLFGVTSNVDSVSFDPSGKLIVAVSNREAVFYSAATRQRVGAVLHDSGRRWSRGTFTPDGRILAICDDPGNVELWDVASRRQVGELRSPEGVALGRVRFTPNGKIAIAAAVDVPHLTFFDMGTRRPIGSVVKVRSDESNGVGDFAIDHAGKTIAVIGDPGLIAFLDVKTHKASGRPIQVGGASNGFAFLSATRGIASADDGTVSVWDLPSGKRIGTPMSVGKASASSPSLSPDGRLVSASTDDGRTYVWEVASGEQYGPVLQADTQQHLDTTWSPDGSVLATAHSRSVALWDMTGRQPLGRPIGGEHEVVLATAFSPNGTTVALGMFGGPVVLRDVASGRTTGRLQAGSDVKGIAFSPDGRQLATAGGETKVRVWDTKTMKPSGDPIDLGAAWAWDVAFSPDGKWLAVATDPNGPRNFFTPDREGAALLFDAHTHRAIGTPMIPGHGGFTVLSLGFSRDSKLLATGSFYYQTQVWDVAAQHRHGKAMNVSDEGIGAVDVSSDGTRVAAGGLSGIVRVWDIATNRAAFAPLQGQSDGVSGLRYSPDGRLLADTTIAGGSRVWDASTGAGYGDVALSASTKLGSSKVSFDEPRPIREAFSPDSRTLLVGGIDNRAMLWNLDPATWDAAACTLAGRNLTPTEWGRYLPAEHYRRTCLAYSAGRIV